MRNFTVLENNRIQTPYGVFGGVLNVSEYNTGELHGMNFDAPNIILTHAGELTPFFEETERRKRKYAVEYYKNGMIKSVSLNEQMEIETPIGQIPAELVTFYDSGELSRVFPLDGAISGFWTLEDERELHIPLTFEFGFTRFTACLDSVAFYKTGDIKSVTLYPGELISVETKYGFIPVSGGFSLYENGALRSCEPASPVSIGTPIGKITANDPQAVVVSADHCSLKFSDSGDAVSLKTAHNTIVAVGTDNHTRWFLPSERPHPTSDETTITEAMSVSFTHDSVVINGERLLISDYEFTIAPYAANCGDCAGCSGCAKSQLGPSKNGPKNV